MTRRTTRARQLRDKGIHYVDCGTSGGVWGLERGYCMMVGGPPEGVRRLLASKLRAAQIATKSGCAVVLANGRKAGVLTAVTDAGADVGFCQDPDADPCSLASAPIPPSQRRALSQATIRIGS